MATPIVIGLTGRARAGKDTTAAIMRDAAGFSRVALADPLKRAAREIFGFTDVELNGALKETVHPFWGFSPRQALQRMGTEGMRLTFGDDVWLKAAERDIADRCLSRVVITDVRFENEARWVREKMRGQVWRVERPGVQAVATHVSEAGIPDELVDFTIVNDGTLESLRRVVIGHLQMEGLSNCNPSPGRETAFGWPL